MTIELAITDETPEPVPSVLTEQEVLECFFATPLDGSYRRYLIAAARRIEALVREKCA